MQELPGTSAILSSLTSNVWSSTEKSRAQNTARTYCYTFTRFKNWCKSVHQHDFLPANPCLVCLYLQSLLDQNKSASTVQNGCDAISWVHKVAGYEDSNPCNKFIVQALVESSKRSLITTRKKAKPITPEMLQLIHNKLGNSPNILDTRFVCMCLLSFTGFLRISELLNIRRNHSVQR